MRGIQRTHEEFVNIIKNTNPNIKIQSDYINAKTKIKCLCLVCGNKWEPIANSLLQGHFCPKCAGTQRKTHEEFLKEVEKLNSNVTVLGKYVSANTKIECECKICNNRWMAVPTSLLGGSGCMECAKRKMSNIKRKPHEVFVDEVKSINPYVEVVGEYVDNKTKIQCKCLVCHKVWNVIPNSLLHGSSCPHCDRDRRRKTHEDFICEIANTNPNIQILDEYLGSNSKIKCRCSICGYEWSVRAGHIRDGVGCPNCKKSRGEDKIESFLQKNKIPYIAQKKFDSLLGVGGGSLSYDFYIPDYNTLIEYNGEQHEKPINYFGGYEKFKKQQEHDKRKRDFANKNKYVLIEIPYTDFGNIENILYKNLFLERG